MKLLQITKELEKKFPKYGAESWDNVGLLVGEKNKEIKKIQISLDATENVIEKAVENGVDLIITHHPLIFSPLKTINDSNLTGKKIIKLIKNDVALYSMHTNLDSAENGLNSYVSKLLGGKESRIIDEHCTVIYKLSVYVPAANYFEVIKKIEGAGVSLNGYEGVSYSTECVERYKKSGEESMYIVNNKKIEIIGERIRLLEILNEIKKIHPYEEVAYEIAALENKYSNGGIGRVFSLETPIVLEDYIKFIKKKLSLENVRIVTDNEKKIINKVAVVNGSGMNFFKKAKKMGADLFITGDIKYHEALDAFEEGIDLVDFGHYESEHFFNQLVIQELDKFDSIKVEVFNEKPIFKYR